MKALTLWPEWIFAICHLGKMVENRPWCPPKDVIGERIALHAAAHIGGGAGGRISTEFGLGAVGAMAAREGWASVINDKMKYMLFSNVVKKGSPVEMHFKSDGLDLPDSCKIVVRSAIVGTAIIRGVTRGDRLPWGVEGQYHWHLEDLVIFKDTISAKGKQRLWYLSDEQDKAVCEEHAKILFDRPTYSSSGPIEPPKTVNVPDGTKIVVA